MCALKLKQLADFFKVGTDVLVDPNMITAHRGFTGKMDWLEHQVEIDKELKRQEYRTEFMEENKDVNHKA